MKKWKMMTTLTLVIAAMLCMCCVGQGQADVEMQQKLFVYLEGGKETFQDTAWMGKIADAVSGAAFLYGESSEVSIELYKVAQSLDTEQGKPITIDSCVSDSNGYQKLFSDLTGNTIAEKSRAQRSNDRLFRSGIEQMIKIVQDSGNGTLLVFSDSAYKSWYSSVDQNGVNVIVISKDSDGADVAVIANALEMSSVDLAETVWKRWSGTEDTPERADQSMKLISSQYIYEQRILSDGTLVNEQDENLGYKLSELSLFAPGAGGYNGEIRSVGAIIVLNKTPSCRLSVDVSQKEFAKDSPISFQAHLYNAQDDTEMYVTEWSATAHLINEAGEVVDQAEVQSQHKIFSGVFSTKQGGQYKIRMNIQNPAWFNKEIQAESDFFTVRNQAPKSIHSPTIEVPIWLVDGETGDYELKLNPEEYWRDDNPLEEMTYELAGKTSSVDIDGNTLYIHKAFLTDKEVVSVRARDAEGAAGDVINIEIRPLRVSEAFRLDYTITDPHEEDGKYGKHDDITVEVSIEANEENLPRYNRAWTVEATVLDAKGTAFQKVEAEIKGAKYILPLNINKSGNHVLEITATNSETSGWVISEQIPISIRNEQPAFIGTADDLTFDIWANAIVGSDEPVKVNLAQFYHDDGDLTEVNSQSNLNYYLDVQGSEGIALDPSGLLEIDPKAVQQSWNMHVVVEDEEREKDVQPLIVHRWDIPALLADSSSWKTSLNWVHQKEKEELFKDTPLEICAEMTFSNEALQKYWDSLGDLADTFEGFPVALDLVNAADLNSPIQTKETRLKWNREDQSFSGRVQFDQSRNAGEVCAVLHMGQLFAEQDIQSPHLTIMERSPVIANKEIDATILIPGPLFINADLEMQPYEIDLEKLVQYEVLDEIRVNVSGLTDASLYSLSGNKYLYTDDQSYKGEMVAEAIWTPEADKEFLLQLGSVNWGTHQLAIQISDTKEANGDTILLHLTVEYKNQKTLIIIGIVIASLLVVAAALIIIWQVTKPKFDQDCKVCITANYGKNQSDEKEVWVGKWRKKEISLRNLLIYSGTGIMDEMPLDVCDKVFLLPAKSKGESAEYYLKNNASQEEIQIYAGQSIQTERKIHLKQDEQIDLSFSNTSCKISLQVLTEKRNMRQ